MSVRAWQWLPSAFENVSVFLKAPQVRLEQAKCSFGIPRIRPRSPQTDYAAFLLLYDAPPFGDELLGAAKIVFGTHLSNNTRAARHAWGLFSGTQCRSSHSALSCSDARAELAFQMRVLINSTL
jgi:hypothetical protein